MNQSLRRRLATGMNAGFVYLAVVVAICILVALSHERAVRWDIGSDAAGTLKTDTLDVLAALDSSGREVEVLAFSAQRRNKEARYRNRLIRDFLRELTYSSKGIRTRFVDLDSDRRVAEEYQVNAYGTVIVTDGADRIDLRERDIFKRVGSPKADVPNLDFRGEGLVTRAISTLLSGESQRVYVLNGHGERGLDELSKLSELMERQGWTVQPLNLLQDADDGQPPAVPEDADALLVLNPKTAAAEPELAAIESYVGEGGAVGLFLEPAGHVPQWAGKLGIGLKNGSIRDAPTMWPHEDWPLMRYGRHELTEELVQQNISMVIGFGTALALAEMEGIRTESILKTSHRGWLEMSTARPSVYEPGEDTLGPHDVGVLMTVTSAHTMVAPGRMGRLAVFGDSSFLTDEMMTGLGNPTFSVNVARWLVGQDDRMSLVGRVGKMRNVVIERATLTRIGWLVMGVWPMLIVFMGGIVWRMRRGR